MLNILRYCLDAERGSAALVCVAGAVIGRQAAIGMDSRQWMAAGAAIAGSILVAIMVRQRPAPAGERVREER